MAKSAARVMKIYMCFLFSGVLNIPVLDAEEFFAEPAFVTLRDSGQVVRFPEKSLWQGGPKMLYDAISADGKTLAVSSPKEGSIYIFNAQTGEQLGHVKCDDDAKGVKFSPNGREIYVSNEGAASVSVVDLSKMAVVATIPVGKMPHNVRFRANGKIAYVTLQGGAGIGVIDTRQRKLTKVILTPGIETPHNLDLSKDEDRLFIRDASGKVGVLDLAHEQMIKVIEVGKGHGGIDVIPNGRYVLTGAIADNVVTVIDTKTLKVIKRIEVGFGSHGIRASKDSRWTYVTITADDQVAVIDNNSFKVADKMDVASFPFWVTVNGNP